MVSIGNIIGAVILFIIVIAINSYIIYGHMKNKKKVFIPITAKVTSTDMETQKEYRTRSTRNNSYRRNKVVVIKERYTTSYNSGTEKTLYKPIICIEYNKQELNKIQTGGAETEQKSTPQSEQERIPQTEQQSIPQTKQTTTETEQESTAEEPKSSDVVMETICLDHPDGFQSLSNATNTKNKFPIGREIQVFVNKDNHSEIKLVNKKESFPYITLGIVNIIGLIFVLGALLSGGGSGYNRYSSGNTDTIIIR
tara:strand:- start:576 stop:1334 length:759 start_codon:yes stop_codon:yes gene_type:complete